MVEKNQVRRLIQPLLCSSVALVVALLICCDDGPTGPRDAPADIVYFHTYGDAYNIRTYDIATGAIDSAQVPLGSSSGLTISADGSRLYISGGTPTQVLDAHTFQPITALPFNSQGDDGVAVSPNNQYIALCGNGLSILNQDDYSIVFRDTGGYMHGTFSPDSRHFFASVGDANYRDVYHLDLNRNPLTPERRPFGPYVWRVMPNYDASQWYVYVEYGEDAFQLQLYNVVRDSLAYRLWVAPGLGDMEVTFDSRYLFFSSIGNIFSGVPRPQAFFRLDLPNHFILDTIRTVAMRDQNNAPVTLSVDKLAFAPDGYHVIACGAFIVPQFAIYNLRTQVIDRCITLTTHAFIVGVTSSSMKREMGGRK